MARDQNSKPAAPELPKYVLEPLETQSVERLEEVAAYAEALTEWKRETQLEQSTTRRPNEEVDESEKNGLEERGVSTDPADHDDVPAEGAYITIKEPKDGYRYYYWQWRDGDSWKNKHIAPVNPRQ